MAMLNDPMSALLASGNSASVGSPSSLGATSAGSPVAVRGRGVKCLFTNCESLSEELADAWAAEIQAGSRIFGGIGDATAADYRAYDRARRRRENLESRMKECCL